MFDHFVLCPSKAYSADPSLCEGVAGDQMFVIFLYVGVAGDVCFYLFFGAGIAGDLLFVVYGAFLRRLRV